MNKLILPILGSAIILTACSGTSTSTASNDINAAARDTYSVKGTVPGTLIEAFCDNGAYYKTNSTPNGTSKHPFEMTLPAGLNCNLVMTTNENDPNNKVVTPIGFQDGNGNVRTRFTSSKDKTVDLGDIPLDTAKANIKSTDDLDGNGIIDSPRDLGSVTDLTVSTKAKTTLDPDGNGIIEPYDDEDKDGIPNKDDADYSKKSTDSDRDGLPDSIDVNKSNDDSSANEYPSALDKNNDGYLDDDADKDGFHDSDTNKDGYYEDDSDHDGFHDDDKDHDGKAD